MRNVQETFTQIVEQVPYLPEELQIAVANIDDPSRAQPPDRRRRCGIKTEEKQALLEEVDVGRAAAPPRRRSSPASSRSSRSARRSSPRSSPRSTRASASTSCASSSRRSRTSSARSTSRAAEAQRAARAARRGRAARGGRASRPTASSRRLEQLPAAGRRARRHPHLPRVDRRRCRGTSATEDNLDLAHAREVLDDDHYDIEQVKDRILEFLAVRKLKPDARGLDPLLRRPARRRQDVARALDRPRAGPRVRAHQRRRRARRGRDPRPPPHLHRRDARHDHPRAARRRLATTRCS